MSKKKAAAKKAVTKKAPVKKTPVKKTEDKKPPVDEAVSNGENEQDSNDASTEPEKTSAPTQTEPETKTNETPTGDAQAQAGSQNSQAASAVVKDDVAGDTVMDSDANQLKAGSLELNGEQGKPSDGYKPVEGSGCHLLVRVKQPLERRFRAGIEFTREWRAIEVDEGGAAWHALHDDHMLDVKVAEAVLEAQED